MMPERWLASRPGVPINGLKAIFRICSAGSRPSHSAAPLCAPRRAPRNSLVLQPLPRTHRLEETELPHVRQEQGIADPIEVIDFVLHHAGVEAADAPIYSAALLVN